MHCFRTGVKKGMKLCTAVQEGCGYKDILRAHRYFAPLAKYFTVSITYQPVYVFFVCIVPKHLNPAILLEDMFPVSVL
jgi:hypothetical protein